MNQDARTITAVTLLACVALLAITTLIHEHSISNHEHCKAQQRVSYDNCMFNLMPR